MKTKRLLIIVPLLLLIAAVTARAVPIDYIANLTGPSEEPPNASPGTGFADVTFDLVAHTMRVQITFSGLLGTTIASHIHSPTAVRSSRRTDQLLPRKRPWRLVWRQVPLT